MSIFDDSYQKEILEKIQSANTQITNEILWDLIKEHQKRATEMKNLNNRFKLIAATNWSEKLPSKEYNGVPILARKLNQTNKINHRLMNPFLNRIVSTLVGYMANDISILIDDNVYSEEQLKIINTAIKQNERLNNIDSLNCRLVEHCALMGTSYILLYKPEKEKIIRQKISLPWETIVIKDGSLDETQYGMRYWKIQDKRLDNVSKQVFKNNKYKVEWYDKKYVSYWMENNGGKFQPLNINGSSKKPHLIGDVPLIEFPKNPERIGDVELSLNLQDAYDIAISDLSSELAQLRLAYMVSKGGGQNIDNDFLRQLEQTGILVCDKDGDWRFMKKDVSAEAIENLIALLSKNIFLFSNSVDFSGQEFSGQMPIMAFKLKTKPLEESAKMTENMFKESFRKLYTILSGFWDEWFGIKLDPLLLSWQFTRNLPVNIKEEVDVFNLLYGKISDATALSRLSFISNVNEEMERIKADKENYVDIDNYGNASAE